MSFFQSIGHSIGKPIPFVNRQTETVSYQNPDMAKALPPPTSFGARIRVARKEAGLTQKQLASKAGMSQSTLSELESGEYPSSSFTAQIADVTGVRGLWLAAGRGPMRSGDVVADAPIAAEARDDVDLRSARLDALRQAVMAMAREFGVTPEELVSGAWPAKSAGDVADGPVIPPKTARLSTSEGRAERRTEDRRKGDRRASK